MMSDDIRSLVRRTGEVDVRRVDPDTPKGRRGSGAGGETKKTKKHQRDEGEEGEGMEVVSVVAESTKKQKVGGDVKPPRSNKNRGGKNTKQPPSPVTPVAQGSMAGNFSEWVC